MRIRRWSNGLVAGCALAWTACGGNREALIEERRAAEVTSIGDAKSSVASAPDRLLPPPSLRDDILYYVMPDRFTNGTTKNDRGDYAPEPGTVPASPTEIAKHGFDPTSATFFHGGDI